MQPLRQHVLSLTGCISAPCTARQEMGLGDQAAANVARGLRFAGTEKAGGAKHVAEAVQ